MSQATQNQIGFYLPGSLPPKLTLEGVWPFLTKYLGSACGCVIGGGEVRPDQQVWIVPYCNKLARAAGIKNIEKYSTKRWHLLMRNLKGFLSADRHMTSVPKIGFADWAIEDRAAFEAQGYEDATFMVGLASPEAYKAFSGARYVDLELLEDRIVEEIEEIYEAFTEEQYFDTVFQFEVPFEMWAGAMLPMSMKKRRALYAEKLESIKRIILRCQPGTRFSFHLCWGDLDGKPAVLPSRQTVGAKIAMMNAIIALGVWDIYSLFALHDPMGDGVHAPHRLTRRTLRKYAKHLLALPEGAGYAIGILNNHHKKKHIPRIARGTRKLMHILQGKKGVNTFYFSTHCGEGRKTVEDTVVILEQHHAVNRYLSAAA